LRQPMIEKRAGAMPFKPGTGTPPAKGDRTAFWDGFLIFGKGAIEVASAAS